MSKKSNSIVYLVGAGPGDLGLLTVRAQERIAEADAIVYDKLANPALLEWARPDAECIYVGKCAGQHSIPQSEIQAILLKLAESGKKVVRLKGGDPFIFGRGGEEIEFLHQNEVTYEIVPGVTAALGAAAYAGIPLSHREFSSAITFLTGHEDPEKQTLQLDFRKYAQDGSTLCIYMGVGQLPRIVTELLEGGLNKDTPATIIQWATLPNQAFLDSSLGNLIKDHQASEIGAPAIIFIGQAVRYSARNNWFTARPLFGKRIVVTRTRDQAGRLSHLLTAQGADVIELPFIKVETEFDPQVVAEVFAEMAVYEWIIFTSANGVRIFFDLLLKAYPDIRCLGPMRIAAVGRATAEAIEAFNLKVDLVPQKANGDTLVNELIQNEGIESIKVLVVTGNLNRKTIVSRLEEEGCAIVDTLPLYATRQNDLKNSPEAQRYRKKGAHAILFTSASTVQSFSEQSEALKLKDGAIRPALGSIGPMTSAALKKRGMEVAYQAPESNLEHYVVETISYLNQNKTNKSKSICPTSL
ncbi:MAG: Uroporphyrinogen-III C-methyltransferase [Opitutia bacterium UBA7350]|nr:MAG: Uroporphyrinogen-III C-methyltransferase [Opitutae bacterium UBA7350]